MGRPGRPGDRLRIEAELSPDDRMCLWADCDLFGLDRERWNFATGFARYWQVKAAFACERRLRCDGMSEKSARDRAASYLGLGFDFARMDVERWQQQMIRRTA